MESSAISKHNRVSASKVRLVANEIRGFSLPEAIDILKAPASERGKDYS